MEKNNWLLCDNEIFFVYVSGKIMRTTSNDWQSYVDHPLFDTLDLFDLIVTFITDVTYLFICKKILWRQIDYYNNVYVIIITSQNRFEKTENLTKVLIVMICYGLFSLCSMSKLIQQSIYKYCMPTRFQCHSIVTYRRNSLNLILCCRQSLFYMNFLLVYINCSNATKKKFYAKKFSNYECNIYSTISRQYLAVALIILINYCEQIKRRLSQNWYFIRCNDHVIWSIQYVLHFQVCNIELV